jgi:hypothetical protein
MDSQLLLIIIPPLSACFGFLLKIFIENYSERIKKKRKEKLDIIEYKLKEFYYPIYINLLRENSIWNKIISIYSDHKKITNTTSSTKTKRPYHDIILSPSNKKSAIPNRIFYESSIDDIEINSNETELTNTNTNVNIITETEEDKNHIMLELDKEILSIHLINQKIIHDNVIKVNPNKILMELILNYDEHVTVYNILRKMKPTLDKFKDITFPSQFNAEYPHELKNKIEEELYKLKNKQNKLCKFLNICHSDKIYKII